MSCAERLISKLITKQKSALEPPLPIIARSARGLERVDALILVCCTLYS